MTDVDGPPFDATGLTPVEQRVVAAWVARSAPRAPLPLQAWNAPGYAEPVHLNNQGMIDATVKDEAAAEAPVIRTMMGSIAIGIVIVSGQAPELSINVPEQEKILQEVLEATQFLAMAEPRANVNFDYDIHTLTVNVAAGTTAQTGDAYERLEAPWRDAALAQMGYAAGRAGYRAYARNLAQSKGTQWSYVAFFTKFPIHHFAYAVYEKVVLAFGNDGWGPDNLNAVFAHETCHIFGAADEYGTCNCHSTHGVLRAPNLNCVNCGSARVPCLMDRNELVLCQHSRLQLGWGPPYI